MDSIVKSTIMTINRFFNRFTRSNILSMIIMKTNNDNIINDNINM